MLADSKFDFACLFFFFLHFYAFRTPHQHTCKRVNYFFNFSDKDSSEWKEPLLVTHLDRECSFVLLSRYLGEFEDNLHHAISASRKNTP